MALHKAMTIAGSDTSGGAGMEADLKTFTAMGVYGMTALTVIVAQNPLNWDHEMYPIGMDVIEKQIKTIVEGIGIDAMKTGMLGSAELVQLVADTIDKYSLKNVVIDPVMVCKGIDAIMVPEAGRILWKRRILPVWIRWKRLTKLKKLRRAFRKWARAMLLLKAARAITAMKR